MRRDSRINVEAVVRSWHFDGRFAFFGVLRVRRWSKEMSLGSVKWNTLSSETTLAIIKLIQE